ncbi:phosphatase PAP2 family protein [Methanobrevibacter sp. YE315]|uniref:phosphatase PAP2 family protein n=1 Tax=Methanobrevibacter sp. YE315 TaxID=1609968 RepID=UPI0009E9FDE0|nr:phosphatase PAP2 family protein [Methanobrevibacter sp. YE315]
MKINILIDPLLLIQFFRDQIAHGAFNSFFVACSIFGETLTATILIAIVYWCLDKKLGEYLLLGQAGGELVNGLAKVVACVYRPWILDSRIKPVSEAIATATGYSFPSGHVTTATVLFGGAALRGKFGKYLNIALIVSLILVAFSRNYLGVHSVLDVIFGFLFTLIVLIIFSKLFDSLDEMPNLDIIISVVGIIISIMIVAFALTKSYPLDYDSAGRLIVDPAVLTIDTFRNAGISVGTFISWPIERRFIKFATDGTMEAKAARCIFGFISLEFIINVICPLMGNGALGNFLQTFIVMVFIILIYPTIIKLFQKNNLNGK